MDLVKEFYSQDIDHKSLEKALNQFKDIGKPKSKGVIYFLQFELPIRTNSLSA